MRYPITISLLLLLSGCADLSYYWQNASSHLSLMSRRIDIDELLADKSTAPELRQRLILVQDIRRFAVSQLQLPDNDSYLSYVQLDRPYVIQNLFAAPEFSTQLHQWCYPIIGCASYRGYYDDGPLQIYADKLETQGLDVYIGQVPAYSTLGWFDDPILSSVVHWPDYRLAGLIFHELTHQQIFIDDDTRFNESLATAVQQVGTELWLRSQSRFDEVAEYQHWLSYRREVIDLIDSTRDQLAEIYASDIGPAQKRLLKTEAFSRSREAHQAIAKTHGIKNGFKRWFEADLNNAKIGSISAYNSLTPAFVNMIRANHYNFSAFYDYVLQLGRREKSFRQNCLQAWSKSSGAEAEACQTPN